MPFIGILVSPGDNDTEKMKQYVSYSLLTNALPLFRGGIID